MNPVNLNPHWASFYCDIHERSASQVNIPEDRGETICKHQDSRWIPGKVIRETWLQIRRRLPMYTIEKASWVLTRAVKVPSNEFGKVLL